MTSFSIQFCEMARNIKSICDAQKLQSPAFRTPPRRGGNRTIRRYSDGTFLVSVRTAEREASQILEDMIEGVVVANCLTPESARALRLAITPQPTATAA